MSTNLIDDMEESEAKALLNEICAGHSIGGRARTASTILENIRNSLRRSSCLGMIEAYVNETVTDDDGSEHVESKLNWGESPEQYIETFKSAIGEDIRAAILKLVNQENQDGSFGFELVYDNHQDGCLVRTTDGHLLGECYDLEGLPEDENGSLSSAQVLTAIMRASVGADAA